MANQLKTVALLGGLSAMIVLLGNYLAPGNLWLFGGIAVVMNFFSYFFSDRIVLRMNRAKEISQADDPQLFAMVGELAHAAELPMPRVYVMHDDAPNAFATGRNPRKGVIAVTTGIRRLLSERELRGVIAHELAHIKNRDVLIATIAAMFATAISLVASMLQWGALLGGGTRDGEGRSGLGAIGALAVAIVAPIAATIIQLAISRSREYLADETGAAIAGDPEALASALAKLERGNARVPMHTVAQSPATASLYICAPFSANAISGLFSTHPPIARRIERLRDLAT
ncbi:MAG: zinc metalloprotease HtpX [Myxococcales bacterium]|nr:zinc metalloprotease HtpX [Myxococcales bacterium]